MEDARFGVSLDFEKIQRFVETLKAPFRKAFKTGHIDFKDPARLENLVADHPLVRASISSTAVYDGQTLVLPLHSGGRVLGLLQINDLKDVSSKAVQTMLASLKESSRHNEVHPFLAALAESALNLVRLRLALETDPLTGLANEYALDEALISALARLVAGNRLPGQAETEDLCLLYIQPAGMPAMLERYGRRFTHNLLKDLAKRVKDVAAGCLSLGREDTRLVLLLAGNRQAGNDLARNIKEGITSYQSQAGEVGINWHMGAALARATHSGLVPAEEASLLRMRANRGLDVAMRLNWPELLLFDEIVSHAGKVRQALSYNRLLLDIGQLHGLKEDARFVVHAEGQDKAEILVVSLGEEDALAEVVNLYQPTTIIRPGDSLRPLAVSQSAEAQENLLSLAGREFMVNLDESSGLVNHHSLLSIFNQLAEQENRLAAALIRLEGLDNLRQVVGRFGVDRLFRSLADKVKSFSQGDIVIGRYAPDTLGILLPGYSLEDAQTWTNKLLERLIPHSERPLYAGIGYFPCPGFSALDVLNNAVKALAHAAYLEPGAVVPMDAVSLNINADSLFNQGLLAEAAGEYEKALLLNQHELNVLNSLGVCYAQLGDTEKAFAMFKRALTVAPDDYMAYYNQGYTFLHQQKWDQAMEKFNQCLALMPNHADTLFQLGRCAQEMGRLGQALDFYQQSQQCPQCPGAVYRYLGEALSLSGRLAEAEEAFKKAIKFNSADPVSLNQLAGLYLGRKANLEIAASLAKRALDINPALARNWQVYGAALAALGRLNEALVVLRQSLSQHPMEPSLLLELGRLQVQTGDLDTAAQSLEMVLKQEPNLAEAVNLLAAIKQKPE